MENKVILKSGINKENEVEKLNNYLIYLRDSGNLDKAKFTIKQLEQGKSYISEPVIISEHIRSCKDMAFLYDEEGNIIGHIYSIISKKDGKNENLGHNLSFHIFDCYLPEDIDTYQIFSMYSQSRIENKFEIEYGIKKYAQKTKKSN